jgi:hypothetical protein
MIASWADVEVRFQSGTRMGAAASGTLRRRKGGYFASEHDFLLPGNHRYLKPASGSQEGDYRRFDTRLKMKKL